MAAIQQYRQRGLDPRYAAPRRAEVPLLFLRRLRRRVIGGDDVDVAAKQLIPELVIVRAERRRTLRGNADPLDVTFGEVEIVRAGFDGDVDALPAGLHS